jgi:parallel beta-helix repeat protein
MQKLALIVILSVLICLIGSVLTNPPVRAESQTIYVDAGNTAGPWTGAPEHPYENITAALTHALQGDTIFVYNGTYHEHLTITKSVTLIGQDRHGTIVDGDKMNSGHVIDVKADNVNIVGFTVEKSGSAVEGLSGIHIGSSKGNNVSHNIIRDNYNGIHLDYSTNNSLVDNEVSNNYYGVSLDTSNDTTITQNNVSSNLNSGMRVSVSSGLAVWNNTVSGNEAGILLLASTDCTFAENNVSLSSTYGVYLFGSTNNTLTANNINSDQDFGIWLSQSNQNLITNNNIFNEKFGVYVTNSTINTVANNKVSSSLQFAIRLDYSDLNVISGNTLSENQIRGALFFYSNNNTIVHNNFINNTRSASNANSTNSFDNGVEGNYWSDYNGTDETQDGIGDSPYVIDENNKDNCPLMGNVVDFPVSNKETYVASVTSNSTISQVQFVDTFRMLEFTVSDTNQTTSFCRITIPQQLILRPIVVLVDDGKVNATTLPNSNATHTFLYLTYNGTPHDIKTLQEPFFELLQTYDTLLENYQNLNSTYYDLLASYNSLNQTLQGALTNYTNLSSIYNTLNQTYSDTLANYTKLQEQQRLLTQLYDTLNQTYQQGQANFTQLLSAYDTLNQTYSTLMNQYNGLKSAYDNRESEYNTMRIALLTVWIATAAIAVTTSTLVVKYRKMSAEQKELAQKYKTQLERIDLLDAARTQFETDVQRRTEKIQDFQNKYGITIRPRASLDEVLKSLELKKKKED